MTEEQVYTYDQNEICTSPFSFGVDIKLIMQYNKVPIYYPVLDSIYST